MKKLFLAMLLVGTVLVRAYAQVPKGINYQAVVRNASGNPLANRQNMKVRFTIFDAGNSSIYAETHSPVTTNQFGLFNRVIGSGTVVSGSFPDFSVNAPHSIRVEVDTNSSGSYINMGTTAFQSVPYALYSPSSAGTPGYKSLVRDTSELPGANCTAGGHKIYIGLDANNNNVLDAGEISQTFYVCNGTQGTPGVPGNISAITASAPLLISNSVSAPNISLGNSGVNPQTYGSPSTIPVITVDQYGRITSASNTNITVASGSGFTASNGLSLNGNNLQLGGTLLSNTSIATGTNNFSFTGSGNVGINTSTPSSRLEIIDNSASPALKVTQNGGVDAIRGIATYSVGSGVNGSSAGSGMAGVYGTNSNNGYGVEGVGPMGVYGNSPSASGIGTYGFATGAGGYGVYGQSNLSHGVYGKANSTTGAAGYFFNAAGGPSGIFTGGNVGIGTSTPAATLDVNGTIATGGYRMPPGASAGRILTTDATGNGSWQDPMNFNSGFSASVSSVQTITSGTLTVVNYTIGGPSDYDDNLNFTPGRFTVTKPGLYHIDASVYLNAGIAGGSIQLQIKKNGGSLKIYYLNYPVAGVNVSLNISSDMKLVAGEYVEVAIYSNSAGTVNILNAPNSNWFNGHRIY